jgi:predicted CoA-binding protein
MAMTDVADELLGSARTVLVVDWPTADVPATLARAGLQVFVRGGPGPNQYTAHELAGTDVVVRQVGHPPDQADLVYFYRPVDELPEIVELARSLGARAVWLTPQTAEEDEWARGIVESAGLDYVGGLDIVEHARRVRDLS